MKEDIKALLDCDVIYMMQGWEDSPGAFFEQMVAMECGITVVSGGKLWKAK